MASHRILWPALAFEGILGIAALALGGWCDHPPLRTVLTAGNDWTIQAGAMGWGLIAALPMFGLALAVIHLPFAAGDSMRRDVDELIIPLFADVPLAGLVAIACTAGLTEEMLFRGYLQPFIASVAGESTGVWWSLGITSIAFGAVHYVSATYAILAAIVSLYLGGLFLLTNNLLAPIVAHAIYDLMALVYLLYVWRKDSR